MTIDPPKMDEVAIATRIHLANAANLPTKDEIGDTVRQFLNTVSACCAASRAYIAVDAASKHENYDLLDTIRELTADSTVQVVPVTPWYHYAPALNALVERAARDGASYCMFISAETTLSSQSMNTLLLQMDGQTLVSGSVLPGHEYHPKSTQKLNGLTVPWNTLAIWNVQKLALTGFPMVAEGVHKDSRGDFIAAGVEEASAIALLQRVLGKNAARAKLIPLSHVEWQQDFAGDLERQRYHEQKMASKLERPEHHLELLGLEGWVEHH